MKNKQIKDLKLTFFKSALVLVLMSVSSNLWAQDSDDSDQLVQLCVACHGAEGISSNDLWPNLAGQQREYLVSQMIAYRDKTREAPLMLPFVKDLTDEQIGAIANHYSSLPPAQPEVDQVNAAGKNIRAYCISCHGLSGNAPVSDWPNLAGQKKSYLEQQLAAYKSGERQHPLMNVIANELTDQQIADVSEYYSQAGVGREIINETLD